MARPPKPLSLLVFATFALGALGACGGGEEAGETTPRQSSCSDQITIHATVLPDGFSSGLRQGRGGGEDPPRNAVVYHWRGPDDDTFIDLYRGSHGTAIDQGLKIRMLGRTGRYGELPGGLAAKVRLGRGICTRYQLEAFGVAEDDFKRVIAGLRRGPAPGTEGAEEE